MGSVNNKKKRYKLDTAALIFPAIARRTWQNTFRFSAVVSEPVDPDILQRAVNDLEKRFPTFFVVLKPGFFWYYLEELDSHVTVQPDHDQPLTLMSRDELKRNSLRILYKDNMIAAEFFHILTDGHGGSVFFCTLIARYLMLKYGLKIPGNELILDTEHAPELQEIEDSFQRYCGKEKIKEERILAYRLPGEQEPAGILHMTTGIIDTDRLLEVSRSYDVSVTAFISAVMVKSIMEIQDNEIPRGRQKHVRVIIPIDLRKLFESKTLRNFVLVVNAGIDPDHDDCSFEELCRQIQKQLRQGATVEYMSKAITYDVRPQRNIFVRLMPVVFKNIYLNHIYEKWGEKCSCLNISNLNEIKLPDVMRPYIKRMEFKLGPLRSLNHNCSLLSYGGKTYLTISRRIRETELEQRFFNNLRERGIEVETDVSSCC